jgi:hypothetical protein
MTINYSTTQGYTAIPSTKNVESFENALKIAIQNCKRHSSIYTFTIVGNGIAQHFTSDGRRLNITANFA